MRFTIPRRIRRTAVVLLVACPTTMLAQATVDTARLKPPTGCLDHLPPSAFTRVVVYAMVDVDSVSRDFGADADNLLQELVFKAHSLLGAKPEVLPRGEPSIDWLGVDAPLHLTAFRDGRIISRDTTKGTAAALLRQALEQTSTVGFLAWSIDSTRDSIPFDIAFLRPQLDSAPSEWREFANLRGVPPIDEAHYSTARVRAREHWRMSSEAIGADAIRF